MNQTNEIGGFHRLLTNVKASKVIKVIYEIAKRLS